MLTSRKRIGIFTEFLPSFSPVLSPDANTDPNLVISDTKEALANLRLQLQDVDVLLSRFIMDQSRSSRQVHDTEQQKRRITKLLLKVCKTESGNTMLCAVFECEVLNGFHTQEKKGKVTAHLVGVPRTLI